MNKKTANDSTAQQPTFEQAIERLEEIVHALESGDLGLNEAMERYEEGVKLLRQSYDLLNRAERKIELLSGVDAEGNPVTEPFDDSATFNPAGTAAPRRARRSSTKPPPDGVTLESLSDEEGMDERR